MRGIQISEYVKVGSPSHLHDCIFSFLRVRCSYSPDCTLNHSSQGPHDLKVTDLPDPSPKPHEYLIAIHASATNFFDLLQIRGKYQHQPALPWVSGMEFSGVVLHAPESLASGAKPAFIKGDKVFGASQGGYATKVCATQDQLRPMPKGWSFFEAAGLFVTAPTSYAGLVTRAGIKKGKCW